MPPPPVTTARHRAELAALAAVLWVWYGYYLLTDPDVRSYVYYAGLGALIAVGAAWAGTPALRPVTRAGLLAKALCMVEGTQQSLCAAAHVGIPAQAGTEDTCQHLIGPKPYQAALALSLSALIVWRWRTRPRP